MLRRGLQSAFPPNALASSSRVLQRMVVSLPPVLRQQPEKLPRGHVRPHRRPIARPPPAASSYPDQQPPPQGYPFQPDSSAFDAPIHVPSRPVSIPYDSKGILQESHAARDLLGHDTLVIVRQIEMLNIFMGFEQANRYAIQTPEGEVVGFLAEEEQSIVSTMSRQFLRTHRPFRAVVMDRTGHPILWIRRPFQFINSRIYVRASQDENGKLVGEAQQEWHPWRRRYNVFQSRDEETFSQFARIDSGLWAWDFWLKDKDDRLVASINRNFRGLGRELFTDTGQYVIRFDSAGTELDLPPGAGINIQGQKLVLPEGKEGGLSLDQRAMTLAAAVSIDFDYFSRHSGSGGMGFPFIFWGGGDGSSDINRGGAAGGGGVEAGTAAGAAAGAAGAGGLDNRGLSEDEQIYGRQQQSQDPDAPRDDDYPGYTPGEQPYGGWSPDKEEVMDDPWAGQQGQDQGGGWFGGGGGGGGDGGDWGDWS